MRDGKRKNSLSEDNKRKDMKMKSMQSKIKKWRQKEMMLSAVKEQGSFHFFNGSVIPHKK